MTTNEPTTMATEEPCCKDLLKDFGSRDPILHLAKPFKKWINSFRVLKVGIFGLKAHGSIVVFFRTGMRNHCFCTS